MGLARSTRRGVLAAVLGSQMGTRPASAQSALSSGAHPLAGQTIGLSVYGLAGSAPSRIAAEMAAGFTAYAQRTHGYEASVSFASLPVATQFEAATAALASPEHHLCILDQKWIAALAAPKAIVAVNPIIQANPGLDIEWYAPAVGDAYQVYPDGTNNRWGFPQAGDALLLFVRRDMIEAEGDAALPRDWAGFEALRWDAFASVLARFTRPERGVYGIASAMSAEYDFISGPVLSFMRGGGGKVWEPKGGQVEGVLNTDGNAAALAAYKALLQFQPPDALGFGPAEVATAFAEGRVFSALQWASAGAATIGALGDKVMVVPAPLFSGGRPYVLGGQSWVMNAACDEAHQRVATDFLAWWFLPETALEYARRGGTPCDALTLSRPDFDQLQPWCRAYRAMLRASGDVWHAPNFAELLPVQQSAFNAYVAGRIEDPRRVLDMVACRQQAVLFAAGAAERKPSEACSAAN